eukprot:CAMPEP_0175476250 /NCGR_PEP_ID=MMETSP0095-20121207/75835_1 /TAXON_ID=311494 /ORGANISM="Alexandrium monilatum, Strain CCMP3105" /LENGTH=129 /DNA_ID=CAMNT_0016777841 /DNA_START=704 /DNA_END=1091 /DNA_ORIENTATION=+
MTRGANHVANGQERLGGQLNEGLAAVATSSKLIDRMEPSVLPGASLKRAGRQAAWTSSRRGLTEGYVVHVRNLHEAVGRGCASSLQVILEELETRAADAETTPGNLLGIACNLEGHPLRVDAFGLEQLP